MNFENLILKAKTIIGSELVVLAMKATSPNQAAIIASWLGYDRDAVQAARAAAIILRDNGQNFFEKLLGPVEPYPVCCLPKISKMQLEITLYNPKTGKYEYPNISEKKALLDIIRRAILHNGINARINSPELETDWHSFTRWQRKEQR